MSATEVFRYRVTHVIEDLRETREISDFEAEFTLSEDGSSVSIEDIFMLEGEERIQIGDDAFEELKQVLLQMEGSMIERVAG